MDLSLRQKDIDFLPEYINDFELDTFVTVIKQSMAYTSLGELILSTCKKSKNGRYKPTNDLKKIMDSFVRSFPEEQLAREGLECDARTETDFNDKMLEREPLIANKSMFKGPSNKEIEELWKKKRQERKDKQDSMISGSICLKRKGLPIDVVTEHINKRLKK